MSLSPIVDIFGVDSIAFYNRVDYSFYGRLRVLASSTLAISGKLVELTGGSAKFAWDAQEGKMDGKLQLKFREAPNFVHTLFGGGVATEGSPDASGYVSTLVPRKGSLVAATGLASISILTGSEADLKFGKYLLKAASATTVQLYAASDIDFSRGTAQSFQADDLSLLSAPVAVTMGGDTNLTGFGLKVTGGASAIAMTAGDTATFEVRPKNSENMSVLLGARVATFPEWGAIVMAKRKPTGELFEAEIFRAKGEGLPIQFNEDKFAEFDVNCTILQDPNQDGVARLRRVIPLTPS